MIRHHLFTIFMLVSVVQVLGQTTTSDYEKIFATRSEYIADGFDFPVGPPTSRGYYNAQGFGKNNHLGDDWNGNGGGNSDLGDPIHAVAHGYVASAEHQGQGWGNVIRIVHFNKKEDQFVESLYAHCETMKVTAGDWVKRGKQIATIGNADGTYWAHLHLELRTEIDMDLGAGYSKETAGFLDPTAFIRSNRPAAK